MNHTHQLSRDHKSHNALREFFFSKQIPYGLALTRICLPLILMVVVGQRWIHAREIYSSDGAPSPIWITYGTNAFLPELPGILIVGLFSVLLVSLLTTALGLCTRISLVISAILYFYFNSMDMLSTMTKYSVIATHVLLVLTVSRCGDIWSLDSLIRRRKRGAASNLPRALLEQPKAEIWPQRLLQILIGVVYFGAAMTKIHTPEFFSGEQMQQWMLTDVNYHNPIGEQAAYFPVFIIISAYITLVWEIVFLFLVWKGLSRVIMLSLGMTFHLLTALLLGLYIFPSIYMVLYLSFLTENDMRKFFVFLKRAKRKLGFFKRRAAAPTPVYSNGFMLAVPTPLLLSAMLLTSGVLGITVEHYLDMYGLRRKAGQYTLKEIPLEKVNRMLAPTQYLRVEDKIFDLQTGTILIGGVIANPRKTFRTGEKILAQCTLNPPHDDMVIQCSMIDKEQRVLYPVDLIVPREQNRCNYYFNVTDALDAGEYALVLKYRGKELLRKTIHIETTKTRVVAN